LATGIAAGAMMSLAAWVLAGATAAIAPPPREAAASASARLPFPSGTVAPGLRGRVTLDAILEAVGQDAEGRIVSPNERPLPQLVQPVNWPDASLGCVHQGQAASPTLVPGWLIEIGDGKRWLSYHASERGQWVLCPPGRARSALPRTPGR
jgi:hypothetical protein